MLEVSGAMAEKKRFPVVFVLLPLVGVLGAAGFFGWKLYADYARSEQEDEEARKAAELDQRERVKAAKQARLEQQQADTGPTQPTEDELANLPKGPGRRPVKSTGGGSQTPAAKAYFSFKAAYEKLESTNENAARKFRVRKLQLDDQFGNGSPSNEPKFVADCDATKAQILEALRNPENQ